jgi:hypothetical protein
MSHFAWGPFGWVECDNVMGDGMTPRLGNRPHPNPQHWHDIRKEALERDCWRCVACNDADRFTLEVHHRDYTRWGRERLEDVYTLCCACHETFHCQRRIAA